MAMEWCKPRRGYVGRVSARKHCLHSRKTNHDDADLDHERGDDDDDDDNDDVDDDDDDDNRKANPMMMMLILIIRGMMMMMMMASVRKL